VLLGYSPDTWTVRTYTREFGCIDPHSVLEYDNGVVFMSQKGLLYFDGSETRELSRNIHERSGYDLESGSGLVNRALTQNETDSQDRIQVEKLPGDYLMVNHVQASATSDVNTTGWFSGYCYFPRATWSRFDSTAFASLQGPDLTVHTQNHYVMLDNRDIFRANTLNRPDVPGTARYFDEANGGTKSPVAAKFNTRPLTLGSPFFKTQLNRVMVDQNVQEENSEAGDTGFLIELRDDFTDALITSFGTPVMGATPAGARQRINQEAFHAVSSVRFEVSFDPGAYDAAEEVRLAEIHKLYVQFQETRQRKSD
jgi:hypothetical protein